MSAGEILLFVCDSLLAGEEHHHLLEGATSRGAARTRSSYHLVEVKTRGALLEGGCHAISGELYATAPQLLAKIDLDRGHPVLLHRARVELEGGSEADAYFVSDDQARGLRRIKNGDWKQRPGAPGARQVHDPGNLVRWAKRRFDR